MFVMSKPYKGIHTTFSEYQGAVSAHPTHDVSIFTIVYRIKQMRDRNLIFYFHTATIHITIWNSSRRFVNVLQMIRYHRCWIWWANNRRNMMKKSVNKWKSKTMLKKLAILVLNQINLKSWKMTQMIESKTNEINYWKLYFIWNNKKKKKKFFNDSC